MPAVQISAAVKLRALLMACFCALQITSDAATQRTIDVSRACQSSLRKFGDLRHTAAHAEPDPRRMLYFLHIPRTAGRTYGACFLKQAWPPSQRCAKSYDVLRLDTSMPDCGLLSSHDDYSVSQFLPADAAMSTQLRDPVQRVLSAYEFAVEVAARSFAPGHPEKDLTKVNTQDVWPWSLLVPCMREDLSARAAKLPESSSREPLDPYNNSLVMPLADFVEHPIAHDLLHNGAAYQVLGLTSYSHWEEAADMRSCAQESGPAEELLGSLAVKKLKGFVHVGLMERLDDSVVALAGVLGLSLEGPAWRGTTTASTQADETEEQPANSTQQGPAQPQQPDSHFLRAEPLWQAYRLCAARSRRKNAIRRAKSFSLLRLPDGQQVEFSPQARARIDPHTIARIRELNSMDEKLYKAGEQMLHLRLEALRKAGQLQRLPSLEEISTATGKQHARRLPKGTSKEQQYVREEL